MVKLLFSQGTGFVPSQLLALDRCITDVHNLLTEHSYCVFAPVLQLQKGVEFYGFLYLLTRFCTDLFICDQCHKYKNEV